jgi:two-component system sensor histidine kinase YesM
MLSFGKMSLKHKALILLLLVGLLPQGLICIIEDNFLRSFVDRQVEVTVNQSLDHLINGASQLLQSFINFTANAACNHQIISLLSREFESEQDRETAFFGIRNEIAKSEQILNLNYPFHYFILAEDGTIFSNFTYISPESSQFDTTHFLSRPWMSSFESSRSPGFTIDFSSQYLYPQGGNKIYFVRNIVRDWENHGVIAVGISASGISRLLDSLNMDRYTSVFLLDSRQQAVAEGESNHWSYAAFRGTSGPSAAETPNGDSVITASIGSREYYLFSRSLSFPSVGRTFRILAVTPCLSLLRSLIIVRYFYLIKLLVTVATVAVLILIIERQIVFPVVRLNEKVKEVQTGNWQIPPDVPQGDEIGELGQSFDSLVQNLFRHVHEIREAEATKRDLEIKFLQSRMNPHFIRNTLNTIRWMAQIRGARSIAGAITSFTKMLNYLLVSSNDLACVREEINYIEQYLYLQKIRYQNKLNVCFAVEESILDQRIPRLIFQPIVENCILHGIAPKKKQGNISISGCCEGQRLVFQIEDDGVGMNDMLLSNTQSKLRALPPTIDSGALDGHGLGLINVQRRIRYYFGPGFGVSIDSVRGRGTTVILSLPLAAAPAAQKVTAT